MSSLQELDKGKLLSSASALEGDAYDDDYDYDELDDDDDFYLTNGSGEAVAGIQRNQARRSC